MNHLLITLALPLLISTAALGLQGFDPLVSEGIAKIKTLLPEDQTSALYKSNKARCFVKVNAGEYNGSSYAYIQVLEGIDDQHNIGRLYVPSEQFVVFQSPENSKYRYEMTEVKDSEDGLLQTQNRYSSKTPVSTPNPPRTEYKLTVEIQNGVPTQVEITRENFNFYSSPKKKWKMTCPGLYLVR